MSLSFEDHTQNGSQGRQGTFPTLHEAVCYCNLFDFFIYPSRVVLCELSPGRYLGRAFSTSITVTVIHVATDLFVTSVESKPITARKNATQCLQVKRSVPPPLYRDRFHTRSCGGLRAKNDLQGKCVQEKKSDLVRTGHSFFEGMIIDASILQLTFVCYRDPSHLHDE